MAKISPVAIIPPLVFVGLAALFYFNLGRDGANDLPSTMIGRDAPNLQVVDLRNDPAPTQDDLRQSGVKLVNFWASWCAPCRAEHPFLMDMAETGVEIIGVNYKDKSPKALAFLDELGDPYAKIGADSEGRTGIDWGVYGIPETFVLDGEGKVLFRHTGPITEQVWQKDILPVIEAAN